MNDVPTPPPAATFSALDLFRVDGQTAIVTGGANGIGRIACLALAEAGAHVAVTDINLEAAERTAEELRSVGRAASVHKLDVMVERDIVDVFKAVRSTTGRIDILVNNVGRSPRMATTEVPLATWEEILRLNQTSMFLCCREAAQAMLEQKSGAIVNISSIMGVTGGGAAPNLPYHATKGAVVNMTRSLACEWADQGIRVNAIGPTYVKTDLTRPLLEQPERMAYIESRTPLGRFAEVSEIAGGILYLASPAASMVTGHLLMIDGGWTAI